MKGKYTKESSIRLLVEKQEALKLMGLSRYPQRSDFEAEEVCAIKAFLGPWPRALEAAGLNLLVVYAMQMGWSEQAATELLAVLMVGGLLRTYEFSECEDLCLDLRLALG